MSQPGAPSVGGNQYEQIRVEGESKVQMGNIHNHNTYNITVLMGPANEITEICKRITAQPSSPPAIERDVSKLGENAEKLASTTAVANKLEIKEILAAFQKSKVTLENVEEKLSSPGIRAKERGQANPVLTAPEIAGMSASLQQTTTILEKWRERNRSQLQQPLNPKKGEVAGLGTITSRRARNASILDATNGKKKATLLKSPRIYFLPNEGKDAGNDIKDYFKKHNSLCDEDIAARNAVEKRNTGEPVDHSTLDAKDETTSDISSLNPRVLRLGKPAAADLTKTLPLHWKDFLLLVVPNPTTLTTEFNSHLLSTPASIPSLVTIDQPKEHQAKSTTRRRRETPLSFPGGNSDFFDQVQGFKAIEFFSESTKPLDYTNHVIKDTPDDNPAPRLSRKATQFSKSAECLPTGDKFEQGAMARITAEVQVSRLSAGRAEHARNRSVGVSPLSIKGRNGSSMSKQSQHKLAI